MSKRIRVSTAVISRPFVIAKYGVDFEGAIELTEDEWELMTDQRLEALQLAAFREAHPDSTEEVVAPAAPAKPKKAKAA